MLFGIMILSFAQLNLKSLDVKGKWAVPNQERGHWGVCPGRKILWGDIFTNKDSTFFIFFFCRFKSILQAPVLNFQFTFWVSKNKKHKNQLFLQE